MASITLNQTRSATATTFTVTSTVTAATGVPQEVFVFKCGTQEYDHIATLDDLEAYGTVVSLTDLFYRQNTVTQVFSNITQAQSAADTHKKRVSGLVDDYTNAIELWSGTENVTYTGT